MRQRDDDTVALILDDHAVDGGDPTIGTKKIALSSLRRSVSSHFAELDHAVAARMTRDQAKPISAKIIARSRNALHEHPLLRRSAGVYLFAQTEKLPHEIFYIGLASHGRTGKRMAADRIADYLTKQYTVLDSDLISSSVSAEHKVWRLRRRLKMLHPGQADRYAVQHEKSLKMGRADTIFFAAIETAVIALEALESALIASARRMLQRAEAGDSLGEMVNKAQMEIDIALLPKSHRDAAVHVIRAWQQEGLSASVADAWISAARLE